MDGETAYGFLKGGHKGQHGVIALMEIRNAPGSVVNGMPLFIDVIAQNNRYLIQFYQLPKWNGMEGLLDNKIRKIMAWGDLDYGLYREFWRRPM